MYMYICIYIHMYLYKYIDGWYIRITRTRVMVLTLGLTRDEKGPEFVGRMIAGTRVKFVSRESEEVCGRGLGGGGYVLVLGYDLELVHMYPGTT